MILHERKCTLLVLIVTCALTVSVISTIQEKSSDDSYEISFIHRIFSPEELNVLITKSYYSNIHKNKNSLSDTHKIVVPNETIDETSTTEDTEETEDLDSAPPTDETTAFTSVNNETTTTEIVSSSTPEENKQPWIETGGGIATVTVIVLVSVLAFGGSGFYCWWKRKRNNGSDKESYTHEILAVRSNPRKTV